MTPEERATELIHRLAIPPTNTWVWEIMVEALKAAVEEALKQQRNDIIRNLQYDIDRGRGLK